MSRNAARIICLVSGLFIPAFFYIVLNIISFDHCIILTNQLLLCFLIIEPWEYLNRDQE